ncbi:hypothetical protein [uncultured Sphaerochaeta sp.]|nr:hypothetical protein [uncultured Sphaerochaeta sp.]
MINPDYKEQIAEQMTKDYLVLFPQYKDIFSIQFCKTDDGVREL